MKSHLEDYFLDVITRKKMGVMASIFRIFLLLLSWPFQLAVACRNWIFDKGWVSRYFPPVPVVISIGNIVVGGTGKTPVTLLLAKEFYDHFFIAILARGYRSQAEKLDIPTILSCGQGPIKSADFCGDEPYLIAENLPKAYVIVGKDRHKASDIAAKNGAQMIILDDGMQHRQLARDYEVVVMDVFDLFGQGYFLPRGLLREGTKSLYRADLIILNHMPNPAVFNEAKKKLEKHTTASIIGTRMEVAQIETFSGEIIPKIEDMKVGIFCGIAHPEYFYKTVTEQGAIVLDTAFTADHASLEKKILDQFAKKCRDKGAQMLLCTEKDKVKILNIQDLALPIAWIKMRLVIVEGKPVWEEFISKVKIRLAIYTGV